MIIICYIDPGAGSFIIQTLIAGLLAVSVFFKTIKFWILGIYNKLKFGRNKDYKKPK